MTRALSGKVGRLGKRALKPTPEPDEFDWFYKIDLESVLEGLEPLQMLPGGGGNAPTVIEMPSAPETPAPETHVPEPPAHNYDIPEHMQIRPVRWRLRGPEDWDDGSEDTVGRCLTEYDVLGDVNDE